MYRGDGVVANEYKYKCVHKYKWFIIVVPIIVRDIYIISHFDKCLENKSVYRGMRIERAWLNKRPRSNNYIYREGSQELQRSFEYRTRW